MNKLDILIMSDNNLDTVGGEQESTKIILKGFKKRFVFGVVQPGKSSDNSFFFLTKYERIKHLIKRPVAFLKYVAGVRQIVMETNPRIIHSQAQVSFFIIALLKKLRLVPKDIYLIHTERGLYTKYNVLFKGIFFFFMKELNILVTTTEFNMNYWHNALEKKGISLNYKVIENTAGQLFEVYEDERDKHDEKKITLGFAGRYCGWKNWPLAVEICEQLNAVMGDQLQVKMAVGCLDDKAYKETKKMFSYLEHTMGTRFEGRINISLEEMDQFYYELDVFILTSKYNTESFGRTLVEAMSRRNVVLTTDAGGSVEVVGDRNNVYTTAAEFSQRILQYQDNKERMEEEKEKNLERVRAVYSLKNNLCKHQNMYGEILGSQT